jgi:IclR family acetate operon transcriptional repressor
VPKPEPSSTAVDRALNILELVVENGRGLTNSEISSRLEIPKSTASYLLRTLEQRRYLRRDESSGRYTIGIKVVGLAKDAAEFVDLREAARSVMEKLVDRTRLTAHLAVLDHGRAIYIHRAEIPGFLRINTWVGKDLAVHSTAVGKILTAPLGEEELRSILNTHGMEAKTPRTLTTPEAFFEELARVRAQRYAVDDEENSLNVRCVAAGVYGGDGRLKAALGLTGASSQLTPENQEETARAVIKAALLISRELGYGSS